MAAVVCAVLMLTMIGVSDGAWCACKPDLSDSALQKTIDYACGAGADCTPIQQGGACYNPNTVKAHCSYAANSYYQRKGQAQQACDFSGTATLTSSDPSSNGCTYPASPSAAGGGGGSGSGSTTNTPPTGTTSPGSSTTTPSSTTPNTFSPTTGGTGGVLGGLGPSGNSISTDSSDGVLCPNPLMGALLVLMLSFLVTLKS